MSDPTPTEPAKTEPDPRDTELQELRADRARREQEEKDKAAAELEELRAYRREQEEKAAKAVKAPVKKADKEPVPAGAPSLPAPTIRKRGKSGAARSWFGEEDE